MSEEKAQGSKGRGSFWHQIFLYGGIAFFVAIMGEKITIHYEKKAKETSEADEAKITMPPNVKAVWRKEFFSNVGDALGPDGLAIGEIEEKVRSVLDDADEDGDGKVTTAEVRSSMARYKFKKGKKSNG